MIISLIAVSRIYSISNRKGVNFMEYFLYFSSTFSHLFRSQPNNTLFIRIKFISTIANHWFSSYDCAFPNTLYITIAYDNDKFLYCVCVAHMYSPYLFVAVSLRFGWRFNCFSEVNLTKSNFCHQQNNNKMKN